MERTLSTEDGVRLAVREWPGGEPGVLLLHGLGSSSHIWDLVVPRLQRDRLRVVAYDQRGATDGPANRRAGTGSIG